jgi:hypothetical protein
LRLLSEFPRASSASASTVGNHLAAAR